MLTLYIFCILTISKAFSANILYVNPVASRSHHIWNKALALELVKKGHNVTLFAPDEDKELPKNYSRIVMEGMYSDIAKVDLLEMASFSAFESILGFDQWASICCTTGLRGKGLQQLLDYPSNHFDLIILDVTLGPCLYPLLHRFKYPPSVAVTPFLLPPYSSHRFGNHLYSAYYPWYGLTYSSNMTFIERVWNFIFMYFDTYFKTQVIYKQQQTLAKAVFGEGPSMEDLEKHFSILLANTDPILDYGQPLPPNIIPVGGLHTRPPKQLPKDLQTLLDEAKNGVILFSLGSNVRSDMLTNETQKALLDAFSKVPQTVVWKFESEIKNLPKNVVVRKWLPQNDILGHPNVRLFIGHGGSLSTQEAVYHGVPIICVPFFADQHINSRRVVDKKWGLHMDFKKITTEYVLQTLREILNNEEYSRNMKKMSRIFRDRPETPLERAVFWVEYVIRHKGAQFLNTPARHLPLYKSSSLDVVLFLFSLIFILLFIIYKFIAFTTRIVTRKSKVKQN